MDRDSPGTAEETGIAAPSGTPRLDIFSPLTAFSVLFSSAREWIFESVVARVAPGLALVRRNESDRGRRPSTGDLLTGRLGDERFNASSFGGFEHLLEVILFVLEGEGRVRCGSNNINQTEFYL